MALKQPKGSVIGILKDGKTVQEKFDSLSKKVVSTSPQEYGAKGDGTTDDSKAFQDAISYLNSQGGGTLNIPAPKVEYLIKYPVFLFDNIEVAGSGSNCRIVFEDPTLATKGRGGFVIGSSVEVNRAKALSNYANGTYPTASVKDTTFVNPALNDFLEDHPTFKQAENASIHDVYIVAKYTGTTKNGGYGINFVNAWNCQAYNIWGEGWTQLIGMGSDTAPETPSNYNCHAYNLWVNEPNQDKTYYAIGFISNSSYCSIKNAYMLQPIPDGTDNGSGIATNCVLGCIIEDIYIDDLGRTATSEGVLLQNAKGCVVKNINVGNAKRAVSHYFTDPVYNSQSAPNWIDGVVTNGCDVAVYVSAKYATFSNVIANNTTNDVMFANVNSTDNIFLFIPNSAGEAGSNNLDWYFAHNDIRDIVYNSRITPQMFGAVADYSNNNHTGTDCTQAFRNAIAFAIAKNYQEVYVPAGLYLITDELNLGGVNANTRPGIRLRGVSMSSTQLIFKAPTNESALISSIGTPGSHSPKGLTNIALRAHPDTMYQGIGLLVKNTCFNHYNEMYIENFDVGIQLENSGDGGFTEFNYFQEMRLYQNSVNIKFVITKGSDGNDGDASFHGNNFINIQNQIRAKVTNPTPHEAGTGVQCIGVPGTATFLYNQYWQMQFFGGRDCIAFDLHRCDTKGNGGKITSEGWVEFRADGNSSFDFHGVYSPLRDAQGPWVANDSAAGTTTPGYFWNVPVESVKNMGRFTFDNKTSKEIVHFSDSSMPVSCSPLPLPSSFADRGNDGSFPAVFHVHGPSIESIGLATYNNNGNKFIFGDVAYGKPLTDFNPTFWFNHDGQSLTTANTTWKVLLDGNNSAATGGFILEDNNLHPKTHDHTDLGQSGQRFRNGYFSGQLDVTGNILSQGHSVIIRAGSVPSSATAAGTAGQIMWANGYLYVCIAPNTWQRATLAAW